MIELDLYGLRVRLCFSFFFTAALTALYSCETAAMSFLACLLHETGHIAAMALLGLKISAVTFYGAGIRITPKKGFIPSKAAEAAVLAAGCPVNLLLFLIFGKTEFGLINLFLCVFNLLPAGGLDGGRLLKLFAEDMMPHEAAVSLCRGIGCTAALLMTAAAFYSGIKNMTVFTAAAFMLITAMADN